LHRAAQSLFLTSAAGQPDGLQLLDNVKAAPDLLVVMISGHGNIDGVSAIKRAYDFIENRSRPTVWFWPPTGRWRPASNAR
jgi:DNA-binding NtrC family response regulator